MTQTARTPHCFLTVDIISAFSTELDGRFSDGNVRLCLSPASNRQNFLNAEKLFPPLDYAFSIPYFNGNRTDGKLGNDLDDAKDDLRSECRLFKGL